VLAAHRAEPAFSDGGAASLEPRTIGEANSNSLTSCREEEAAPVDDTEVTHSMNGPDFPDLNRAQGKASMLRE
jgi:hypothetical protein